MPDDSPIAHEGNPKEASITIEGGNLLTTATLSIVAPFEEPPVIIPPETPPPPGGPGECTPSQASTRDAIAIELCAGEPGDGVVTFPGDYTFDPVYYGQACENYYGNFVFGLNSSDIGDSQSDPSALYVTTPEIFIPPSGSILFNSTCPALVSRQLIFNLNNAVIADPIVYTNLTPENFQTNFIDADNTHFGVDIVTHDPAIAGQFDCRFQFSQSGSEYYSFVRADYAGELGTGIAGIGMITDTGTGATITGYGLIIDRTSGTVKFVKWDDVARDNFELLGSAPYTPAIDDQLTLRVRMECLCPYPGLPSATPYPVAGSVFGGVVADANINFETNDQSLTATEWRAMRYAACMSMTVDNDQDLNLMGFRMIYTKFFATRGPC